jgi:hypothetical protein
MYVALRVQLQLKWELRLYAVRQNKIRFVRVTYVERIRSNHWSTGKDV